METSTLFGKPIQMTDLMKTLETEYEIDFHRINPHLESEKDFIKGVKKNG